MNDRAEIERLLDDLVRTRAKLANANDGLTGLHREADGLAAENDRQHAVIEQLRAELTKAERQRASLARRLGIRFENEQRLGAELTTAREERDKARAQVRILALYAEGQLGYLRPSDEWMNLGEPLNDDLQDAAHELVAQGLLSEFGLAAEAGDSEGCGGPGCTSFGGCAVCGPEAAMAAGAHDILDRHFAQLNTDETPGGAE